VNISEFCIRHPVATTLMSAALVVSGIFALMFLPVAALPRTEFPVISVTATLPGASPTRWRTRSRRPLIKQFSTIASHRHDQRAQHAGVELDHAAVRLNGNIDSAAADVQSAIARVQRQMPPEMTTPPSFRKINPADAPILILALSSDIGSAVGHGRFAEQVISLHCRRLKAWRRSKCSAPQKYAVRIKLNQTLWRRAVSASMRFRGRLPAAQRQHAHRYAEEFANSR